MVVHNVPLAADLRLSRHNPAKPLQTIDLIENNFLVL